MQQDPNQWVMQTGDYSNHRFSKLKQISASERAGASERSNLSTGTVLGGHGSAALVIGDVMYVHCPYPDPIFALDLNNAGKILWKYEPKQDPSVIPVMCCDTVNRGLAYADGKLFLNQADATLIALDAKTGKLLWSVKNGDPSKGETGTSVPVVVKDKVLVGISGAEFGVRGRLTAYDMKTSSRFGWPIPRDRTRTCWSIPKRQPNWASRLAKTPALRPGKATNGRPAAVLLGAGIPTIPN